MPVVKGASLYFPARPADLHKFLPNARTNGGLFRKPSQVSFDAADQRVQFNFMPDKDRKIHLEGLTRYLSHLVQQGTSTQTQVKSVTRLLPDIQCVLGLVLQRPFELNSDLTATLFTVAYLYRGFVFMLDSIYSGEMETLCGPVVLEPNRALIKALKAARPRA